LIVAAVPRLLPNRRVAIGARAGRQSLATPHPVVVSGDTVSDAELTRQLALYGALVATVALFVSGGTLAWTIFRDLHDTGRVKIEMTVGRMLATFGQVRRPIMTPEGPQVVNLSERDRLFITITNVGPRVIKVSQVSGFQGPRFGVRFGRFAWRRQAFILGTLNLPKALQPGEQVVEWMDDPHDIEPVRTLYVSDTTGRRWRVRRRLLQQIKRRVREPEASIPGGEHAGAEAPHGG
jgi:hypothetical protein